MHVRRYLTFRLQSLHLFIVVFPALPDHLQIAGFGQLRKSTHNTLVKCAGAKASPQYEDGFFVSVQSEVAISLHPVFFRNKQVLPAGIACQHNLLFRKKSLHPFIRHTDSSSLLCQHLIGHTGIGVLLLKERRYTFCSCRSQCGATGIASYSHSNIRLEILDNLTCLPHTFEEFQHHRKIFQEMLTVKAGYRQADNPVSCCRHPLHLHPVFRSHEKDFTVGPPLLHCIGNADSGENMSTRTTATDDYPLHT